MIARLRGARAHPFNRADAGNYSDNIRALRGRSIPAPMPYRDFTSS